MAVRYRPMRPNDAKECVEIVAAHPFIGPRYGSGTTDLRTVWLSLLGREAFRAVVFEDGEDTQVRIMGVGVSAFVSHDFLGAFVGEHRGFLLKELVSHGMSLETLEGTIRSGVLSMDTMSIP